MRRRRNSVSKKAGSTPPFSTELRSVRREHATPDLITLNRFKQGFDVAFAKAAVALALNKFEEHGPQHRFREYLQQESPLTAFRGTVQQNSAGLQLGRGFAMIGQASFQRLVIRCRRCRHKARAETLEDIPGLDEVIGKECDVLHTFTVELHQEFFDLP